MPTASNLYHQPGQTIPNLVISKVGADGTVCIFTQLGSDLVADLQGWFTAGSYEGMTPVRVLETRSADGQIGFSGPRPRAGQTVRLHVGGTFGVPADAAAVVLNVTAVDPTGAGYVTVWPCGASRPTASNLYHQPGQTIPSLVIAKLGTGGDVCIFTQLGTDLVADLQGWYPTYGLDTFAAASGRPSSGTPGLTRARSDPPTQLPSRRADRLASAAARHV
jgi:hypothetical protein